MRTRVRTCAHHYDSTPLDTQGPDAASGAEPVRGRTVANEERKRFINAPRGRSLVVTARWLSGSGGERSVDKLARG